MQDILLDFLTLIEDPPVSALFIMIVSVTISSISNLAMRKFANMRRLRRYQAEIKQHQEMPKEAERTQDEKLLRKIKRRKAYIERIQGEMLKQRCKPTLIFIIPFMLIFTLLRNFYSAGGEDVVVAILPFNVNKVLPFLVGMIGTSTPFGFGMTYWGFYFLCGLGLSSILQRIMGTQIT
jgi:uncharacterized membrane protein (DUF106 family)